MHHKYTCMVVHDTALVENKARAITGVINKARAITGVINKAGKGYNRSHCL